MSIAEGNQPVVVITGAARGIGLNTAKLLATQGTAVVGVDVMPNDDDSFAAFHRIDLTDAAAVEEVFAKIAADVGPITGVVNNAAVVSISPFLDASLDDLDLAYAVNLRALFHVAQVAGRQMRGSGGGSIVNLASVNAERGVTGTSVYSLTKGGVEGLTRTLAVELAPYGIRCNAVAPAPTGTDRVLGQLSEADVQLRARRIPLGRLARPSEIADGIAFLLSDSAAFINGQVLAVDGGYLAFGS